MGRRVERARAAALTADLHDRYLSTGDVARLLECAPSEVGRMVHRGELSAVLERGCYRFPPAEVRRFIATGGAPAPVLELLPAHGRDELEELAVVAPFEAALAESGEPLWP